jgi:hypothetical protein
MSDFPISQSCILYSQQGGLAVNMKFQTDTSQRPDLTAAQLLLKSSMQGLDAFSTGLNPLRKAIRVARNLGDENEQKVALRLQSQMGALEPSITMIGQIKSGKTSLVNCMIGLPGLLPADVNPWTSVVTSLHLSPTPLSPETSAKFCFFEENEWERLIAGGGRIGELANRAGADDELSKIKVQVEQMREKSKARLGRKFEMLLGQNHEYGYFDSELIERYVCLGDEFDDVAADSQGRFADITRSADLHFHQPALPMRLCIRDTPGVNDTFMMREQITIRSIRDSRICVVVLSAHQALSSTDLALVRLISNVKSRDVIIFVNRIDELSNPASQVPQIKNSILQTLAKFNGPADAQIVFGSALWAQNAMSGPLSALPEASKAALINWAQSSTIPELRKMKARKILWELSGLPELYSAISDRVAQGIGGEASMRIATNARNLINGIQLTDNLSAKAQVGETTVRLDPAYIAATLTTLRKQSLDTLKRDLETVQDDFSARLERVHDSFLGRATEALILHLERYGEHTIWEYDPSGLRVLLSSSYKSFGKKSQIAYEHCVAQITTQIEALYHDALKLPEGLFDIKAAQAPRVPPPVSLGQTIALDLKGTWWKSWWFRRRGYQAYAPDFHTMIKDETTTFLTDLKSNQAIVFHDAINAQVEEFLTEQSDALLNTVTSSSLNKDKIDELFDRRSLETRDAELRQAHRHLDVYTR